MLDCFTAATERAQSLLAAWHGVDDQTLVRTQLAHFADVGSRIAVNGPKLHLNAAAAQAIGLALHELATDAGKYGALSIEVGRVDVRWRLRGGTFMMSWTERNGPPMCLGALLGGPPRPSAAHAPFRHSQHGSAPPARASGLVQRPQFGAVDYGGCGDKSIGSACDKLRGPRSIQSVIDPPWPAQMLALSFGEHIGRPACGFERGVRAVGKTVSNRARRVVPTETRRHKLHRCEAPDDGADSPACSILRTGRLRMCPARGIQYKGAGRSCHG